MEEQNKDTQNPNLNQPQQENPTPVAAAPTSTPNPTTEMLSANPVPPTNPTPPQQPTTPAPEGNKGNGLILVAIILIALVIVLGILYYIIIKQSYKANTDIPAVTPAVQTITPIPSPTVTPSDDQILNDQLQDPTQNIDPLDKSAASL